MDGRGEEAFERAGGRDQAMTQATPQILMHDFPAMESCLAVADAIKWDWPPSKYAVSVSCAAHPK